MPCSGIDHSHYSTARLSQPPESYGSIVDQQDPEEPEYLSRGNAAVSVESLVLLAMTRTSKRTIQSSYSLNVWVCKPCAVGTRS